MRDKRWFRYSLYAIAEVSLVVVGILIALQIDNWEEERDAKAFEDVMLQQIDQSIKSDLNVIHRYYLTRLEVKEQAVKTLLEKSFNKQNLTTSEFMALYDDLGVDYNFNLDNGGAYATIKAKGFDLIQDPEMRRQLTRIYERTIPIWTKFINDYNSEQDVYLRELERTFLQPDFIQSESQEYNLKLQPVSASPIENPIFIKILYIEKKKAEHQRMRIDSVINMLKDFQRYLADEVGGDYWEFTG